MCLINPTVSDWQLKRALQPYTDRQTIHIHRFQHLFWSKSSQKKVWMCCLVLDIWIALVNLLIMSSSSSFSSSFPLLVLFFFLSNLCSIYVVCFCALCPLAFLAVEKVLKYLCARYLKCVEATLQFRTITRTIYTLYYILLLYIVYIHYESTSLAIQFSYWYKFEVFLCVHSLLYTTRLALQGILHKVMIKCKRKALK